MTDEAVTVNSLDSPVVKTSLERVSIPTWMLLASKNRTDHCDGKFAGVLERTTYFEMDAGIGNVRVMTIFQTLLKRTSCVNPERRNKLPEEGETELLYV